MLAVFLPEVSVLLLLGVDTIVSLIILQVLFIVMFVCTPPIVGPSLQLRKAVPDMKSSKATLLALVHAFHTRMRQVVSSFVPNLRVFGLSDLQRQPVVRALHHSSLVSWCFEPSQPQRIISSLRETFIKRYVVERTNKAER